MSNPSVNTVFAGESNPSSEMSAKGALILVSILTAVAAPFVLIFAFLVWACFSWLRIKRSVISSFLGIYIIITLLLSPFINVYTLAINSFTTILPDIINSGTNNLTKSILSFYFSQLPASIIVGGIIGLGYASWRWWRRASWQEHNFRLTPIQWYTRRKNIKEISHNLNTPIDGLTVGIAVSDGRKIIQTDREAAAHTMVLGASGVGKTETLMSMERDIIERGHGTVFVDLKNDPKVAVRLEALAKREGKIFRHWIMQSQREQYLGPSPMGPAYYDPITRGEASRRKDLLIGIHAWENKYYKTIAEEYLQKAFNILIAVPKKNIASLEDITFLLNPKNLLDRSIALANDPSYRNIIADIERMNDEKPDQNEKSVLNTLRIQMQLLSESVTGPWIRKDPNGENNIDLYKVAQEGEIILFSLDSSNYPDAAKSIANLIIQDLKTVSSELLQSPSATPLHVMIDEFQAVGSDNIVGLINKARASKMPIYLSTQALGDLRRIDPAFLDQLFGIVNCFFIHRPNLEHDAEIFAGLTGRVMRKKFRQSVEHEQNFFGISKGSGSGSGTLFEEEEYRVTVSELQSLGQGEMIYISKSPAPGKVERVQVILEKNVAENIKHENFESKPMTVIIPETKTTPDVTEYVSYTDDTLPTIPEDGQVNTREPVVVKTANKENLSRIFNKPVEAFSEPEPEQEFKPKMLPISDIVSNPNDSKTNLKKPVIPANKPAVMKMPERKPLNPNPTPKTEQKKDNIVETKTQKDKFDF